MLNHIKVKTIKTILGIERARDVSGVKKFLNILKLFEIIPSTKADIKAMIKLKIHLVIVEITSNTNLLSVIISFILIKTSPNVGR